MKTYVADIQKNLAQKVATLAQHGLELEKKGYTEKGLAIKFLVGDLNKLLARHSENFEFYLKYGYIFQTAKLQLVAELKEIIAQNLEKNSVLGKSHTKIAKDTLILRLWFKEKYLSHSNSLKTKTRVLIQDILSEAENINTNQLQKLPDELLILISDFLPLKAALDFSLTEKNKLGLFTQSYRTKKQAIDHMIKIAMQQISNSYHTFSADRMQISRIWLRENSSILAQDNYVAQMTQQQTYGMACYYDQFNNADQKYVFWLQHAANKGHKRALYKLAIVYNEGLRGIGKSIAKASEYIQQLLNCDDTELATAVQEYLNAYPELQIDAHLPAFTS